MAKLLVTDDWVAHWADIYGVTPEVLLGRLPFVAVVMEAWQLGPEAVKDQFDIGNGDLVTEVILVPPDGRD